MTCLGSDRRRNQGYYARRSRASPAFHRRDHTLLRCLLRHSRPVRGPSVIPRRGGISDACDPTTAGVGSFPAGGSGGEAPRVARRLAPVRPFEAHCPRHSTAPFTGSKARDSQPLCRADPVASATTAPPDPRSRALGRAATSAEGTFRPPPGAGTRPRQRLMLPHASRPHRLVSLAFHHVAPHASGCLRGRGGAVKDAQRRAQRAYPRRRRALPYPPNRGARARQPQAEGHATA